RRRACAGSGPEGRRRTGTPAARPPRHAGTRLQPQDPRERFPLPARTHRRRGPGRDPRRVRLLRRLVRALPVPDRPRPQAAALPGRPPDRGTPPARLPVDGLDRALGRRLAPGFRRGQRLGHRLGPDLPGPARVLRPQRARNPRHRAELHRRHRPVQAPLAHPQQRPGGAAGLHPRRRGARAGVNATGDRRAEDSRAAPLRIPAFRLLMGFRILTILSYQCVAVTVGWHVYELTRDPWMLGLVGLAEVLPYFCVAPFAGHLVDVLPRRRLGAFAAACLAITPLLLMAIAAGWWTAGGTFAIYAAIALTGCVRAFLGPVYNALFGRVLPRAQFVRGASLGSIVFQAGLVTGPTIGGFLVGWAGKPVAYAVAAVFAACAALAMLRMQVEEPAPAATRTPVLSSIAEGARFVFGHQ